MRPDSKRALRIAQRTENRIHAVEVYGFVEALKYGDIMAVRTKDCHSRRYCKGKEGITLRERRGKNWKQEQ